MRLCCFIRWCNAIKREKRPRKNSTTVPVLLLFFTMTDTLCPVCQDSMPPELGHELPCGHRFHSSCIIAWFRRGENSCPVCRDTGSPASSSDSSEDEDTLSFISSDASGLEDLERFRLHSSRREVAQLVRASLAAARRSHTGRSRSMRRLRVRANRFIKATDDANDARRRANLFLHTHTGPLLQGVKRYNALVRMWGTRERRLRDAALDLYLEHSVE